MKSMELRVLPSNLLFSDEQDLIVEGLVNRTESWSHELGIRKKFKERISKGAFNRAIQEAKRIDFLGEHRNDQLLATTENGSLVLWEDEEGLKMRAKISPTSYGKDFYTLMKDGLVNHMSFGFRSLSDKWKKLNDGTFERTIDRLALSEVSVVRNPAYPQSAISARGIDVIEDVEIPVEVEEESRGIEDIFMLMKLLEGKTGSDDSSDSSDEDDENGITSKVDFGDMFKDGKFDINSVLKYGLFDVDDIVKYMSLKEIFKGGDLGQLGKKVNLKELKSSVRSLEEKLNKLDLDEEVVEETVEVKEEEKAEETTKETEIVEETVEVKEEEKEEAQEEKEVVEETKVEEERNFMLDIAQKYRELQKYKR